MRFRNLKKQSKNNKQVFQHNKTIVVYVPYVNRIKAFITDTFMIYMPLLYVIAYVVLGGKDEFQASIAGQFSAVAIYAIIYALFLSKTGQTPGKKAYGIIVLDATSEKKLSFIRALWRFVAFLISATLIFGILMPLFRKDKKALHDLLSQSKLVPQS
jgi:uncharacterized RDD family membrane protein YckC